MGIKPLFTAAVTAIGGRNGHFEAEDDSVSVNLFVLKQWAEQVNQTQRPVRTHMQRVECAGRP